jgi:hypothetical protein
MRRYGPPPAPRERHGALQKLIRSHVVHDLERDETRRPYEFGKVRVGPEGQKVLADLRAYVLKTGRHLLRSLSRPTMTLRSGDRER